MYPTDAMQLNRNTVPKQAPIKTKPKYSRIKSIGHFSPVKPHSGMDTGRWPPLRAQMFASVYGGRMYVSCKCCCNRNLALDYNIWHINNQIWCEHAWGRGWVGGGGYPSPPPPPTKMLPPPPKFSSPGMGGIVTLLLQNLFNRGHCARSAHFLGMNPYGTPPRMSGHITNCIEAPSHTSLLCPDWTTHNAR